MGMPKNYVIIKLYLNLANSYQKLSGDIYIYIAKGCFCCVTVLPTDEGEKN